MKNKKRLVTIRILDEVNVLFSGLRNSDYEYLFDKYGIFMEGHFFSPKFKLGAWDGKKHFFSKLGRTYNQLVPEILEFLDKKGGYNYKLVDDRKTFDVDVPEIDEHYLSDNGITLGDHQVEAINALTQNQSGIFIGGTGAGKTLCCAAIAKLYFEELQLRTIIVVPSSDLISQTMEEISAYVDVGEYSGDTKDLNHVCVVSTWQALQNNRAILGMFPVAIVDECHGVKGDVLKKMLNQQGSNICVKIGVTGTLPKTDIGAMSVRVTLGNVVSTVTAAELIDRGWLARPNLTVTQLKEDFTDEFEEYYLDTRDSPKKSYIQFKNSLFSDFTAEKNYIQKNVIRNKFLANWFTNIREREKGNTFILINGVAFGKRLAKLIPNAHFISGKDVKAVRKEIYALFAENNDMVVISTFQLASTGLNIKRIFNLVLLDAGKSFIQIIQSIGRGLRKAHDKDTVNIYDICSDLKYSKKHSAERKKHYTSENYGFKFKKIDYDIDE